MTPEQIKALVDQLLRTGEILATKAFEISMKQVYAMAVVEGIWGIGLVILAIFCWKTFAKARYNVATLKGYDNEDKRDFWSLMSIITGIVGGVVPIFAAIFLTDVVLYLMNPEWYAVRWLLEDLLQLG